MTDLNSIREQFQVILQKEIKENKPQEIKDIRFKNPIFMGGSHSSGTTLLRSILGAHKNIACGNEAVLFDWPKIFDVRLDTLHKMFLEQDFRMLDGERINPIQLDHGQPYFGLYLSVIQRNNYHDPATIEALFNLAKDPKHFLDLFFSNYASRLNKTRWAEKSPNNVFTIDEIFKMYPDAKFVHVVRDGRDVVISMIQKLKWRPISAIHSWLMAVEAGMRFRGDPRYFEVKYEDLVLENEKTLRALMEFLEDDFDTTMLEYWKKGDEAFLGYGTQPIFTSSVAKWKNMPLDPISKRTLDLMLRDKLMKLGYEVT